MEQRQHWPLRMLFQSDLPCTISSFSISFFALSSWTPLV